MIVEENLDNIIEITEEAISFFLKRNIESVFLSIKPSGCSGFSYEIEDKAEDIEDFLLNKKNGFKVYINKKSVSYYINTVIDLEKNKFNEKIIFKNPNIKDSCGCGESFNIK